MYPIDRLLQAITAADVRGLDGVWAGDAVLDATVPNWRMRVRGEAAIRAQLSGWYTDPGRFEDLDRIPIPGGELVQFLLTWTEGGIPHAAHQAHVIRVTDDRIVSHVVYCGGRWPAGLLAEMAEAELEAVRG
jgi:hypothetical protein